MNQIRTLHRLLNDKFEEIERYDDLIAAYTKDASRLEVAKWKNEYLKIAAEYKATREHSFSLTYAKKEVNELEKKIELAKRLWS